MQSSRLSNISTGNVVLTIVKLNVAGTRKKCATQTKLLLHSEEMIAKFQVKGSSGLLETRQSLIDGKGIFAKKPILARKKIGELIGERISLREARRRARKRRKIAIVETGHGHAIDASVQGNEFRYINHSCSPNTFIRIYRGHVEFYSLRFISPGEELTCNYGESHHDGQLRCKCNRSNCQGFL